MIDFRDPPLLLAALAAVPVFWLARRPMGRLVFSSLRLLPGCRPSMRARLSILAPILLALGAAALGVALAGPRLPDQTARVARKGIAIMLAVDISGSMRALDLSDGRRERTRLGAVKEVLDDFVSGGRDLSGRPDDTIGLVTFSRYADCRCPLTLDHRNLLLIAKDVGFTDPSEDGTAIGDGLGLALERLRESKAESRIVVLLTDGVNNAGEETPLQAAEDARALGVRVYTIGAGTEGLAPIRVTDPYTGREVLRQIPAEVDEKTLAEIADKTGGRFFRATDATALREVYRDIDRLERTQVAEVRYLQYREYFDVSVALGMGLIALALLLGATVFRRAP